MNRPEYERAWRQRNPERMRAYARKHLLGKKYGITPEDYDALLEKQGGVCALCLQPERVKDRTGRLRDSLSVDHDHATGAVRALLCHHCNTTLGHVNDDPALLLRMAAYLQGGAS